MTTAFPIQVVVDDSLDGTWSPWRVKSYVLGQAVQLAARVFVEGILTDQAGLTVALADEAGTFVATSSVQRDGVGLYHSTTLLPLPNVPGSWTAVWYVAGQAFAQRRFYVDKPLALPPALPPPPPPPLASVFIELTGPATVTAVPNAYYVCDVTGGSIVINVPTLLEGQWVGANAAAGGGAYATNSITLNATSPQKFAQAPPNNLAAPVATYIIGGPSSSDGGGAGDAGAGLTWVAGGITNVLSLL